MRGKRFYSFVAAMLLCSGMLFGLVGPTSVAAQADELSQREFKDLVATAQEDDPVFGPEDGELEHDPDVVALSPAGIEVADFLATLTFGNPYDGAETLFDYGIQFRAFNEGDEPHYLRFLVLSSGTWVVIDSADELLLEGEYDDLDVTRRGENELAVYAEAELVHLGINGDYVGTVEVANEEAGDVYVGTSFYADTFQEGAASEFTEFTVWELGGSSRSNNDDEPTPEDDSGNADSNDRGPLGPRTNDPSRNNDEEKTPEDEPTAVDEDEPTPEPENEGQPSRDDKSDGKGNASTGGTVYESPTYGYTFQYDDSIWQVASEDSSEGFDTLVLTTEVSTLNITGVLTDLTPSDCVAAYVQILADSLDEAGIGEGFSLVDDGEISGGPLDGAAFAETLLSTEGEDGTALETTAYFVCGPLAGSDASIVVRHIVATAAFADESELRETIIETLSADGQPSSDTGADDEPAHDKDEPAQEGAVYESPSYGFSLRYDDSVWELSGESSNEGLDIATLSNGISTLSLFGLPGSTTPAECVEALLGLFVSSMEEAGIVGEIEVANQGQLANGPLEGSEFAEVVFLGETDEGTVALAIFVSCGSLGGSDHHVGVRHFVLPDAYEGESAARDELLAGLSAQGEAPADTGNDEPSRDDDNGNNGGSDVNSPNVTRNSDGSAVYTSPTYSFTVEILPGFSVEQDTVANGYDTLVIANDQARITVAGFASGNSAATCADSIIANLNADPSFTNVNVPVDEQGVPIRVDEAEFSAVPVYLTVNENGQQVVYGRLYACFSFTGVNGGSSMLVYAYETPGDVFVDEFDNIVAMLDLIQVP